MGSGEDEDERREETTQDTGLVWRKVRGRWKEILGPAWQVDLFVGDAPCLAGLGQAGLADVMRDVVTKVDFRAPYLHDGHAGMLAPGAATRTTTSWLLGRTRETGTWKLSHD